MDKSMSKPETKICQNNKKWNPISEAIEVIGWIQWRSQELEVGYSQEKENNKLKKLEL